MKERTVTCWIIVVSRSTAVTATATVVDATVALPTPHVATPAIWSNDVAIACYRNKWKNNQTTTCNLKEINWNQLVTIW